MRDKCLICKFNGKSVQSASLNTIYRNGKNRHVHLCYSHSVEFFKCGQVRFILKYEEGMEEHGLTEDDHDVPYMPSGFNSIFGSFR